MTGAYLRVERDGVWQNIEVEYLTEDERESLLHHDDRLMEWLDVVCRTLVDAEAVIDEIDRVIRG